MIGLLSQLGEAQSAHAPAAGEPVESPWPSFHHDSRHTGVGKSDLITGVQKWSKKLKAFMDSSPIVGAGGKLIYIGSTDGNLYALNASDSAQAWTFKTGGFIQSTPALSPDGKTVYIGSSDKHLYAVSASTGKKIWDFSMATAVRYSAPAVGSEGNIYIEAGNLYAIDQNGKELWKRFVGARDSSPAISPDGKRVYIGGDKVYALDSANGDVLWTFNTITFSSPAVTKDGKVVYIGAVNGNVYAIDAQNCNEMACNSLWASFVNRAANSTPAISPDEKVIYAGSTDGRLYAIAANNGLKKWFFTAGDKISHSSPAVSQDGRMIYVASYDNRVYGVEFATGKARWSFATGDAVASSPCMDASDVLYVASEDGKLYAIK
jgi:outer membrane protein assembly factor BamB